MDTAVLYAHQREAAEWLATKRVAGLFDEQGLGKTAATIAAMDKISARRVLVVAPVVVAHNWKREVGMWSPTRSVQVVTSGSAKVDPDVSVVITTHALLLAAKLFAQLTSQRWDVVVLDEAHAMKNPAAKRTKAFYCLGPQLNAPSIAGSADRVWVLTGTPMPNDPTELWTMLYGLEKKRLIDGNRPMNWFQFRSTYCHLQPVPFGPRGAVKITGAKNIDDLRARMAGFSMRRLKEDHLNLPPVRRGVVAVSPEKLPPALLDIEKRFKGWAPEDIVRALREETEFSTWRRLCGTAKAEAAAEMLVDELTGSSHKVVVFVHHLDVLATVKDTLVEAGFGVVRISGVDDAAARQNAVQLFQTDPSVRVAVCQIVAGGVGITLTAAHDVVFVEQSFVPGENAQAADRCHRIGQTESVLVRTLVLAGSVDALIAEILSRKTEMITEVLK